MTLVKTHVHDTNADVGDVTPLEGNEKLLNVKYHPSLAVFTLEMAFDFDTNIICMFLGKDGERRTMCSEVVRHFLIKLHR